MQVYYENGGFSDAETLVLEAAGWKIDYYNENPGQKEFLDEDGKHYRGFLARHCMKEFETPRDAVLEIERLLKCDTVSPMSQDGCPIHIFMCHVPGSSECKVYSGFRVLQALYPATCPATPREVVELLDAVVEASCFTMKQKFRRLIEARMASETAPKRVRHYS